MDNQLAAFREQIDDFMQFHPQSPLDDDQRDAFRGLNYYEDNPALKLTVTVERLPAAEPLIEMETSTGDARPFRRWGTFGFVVDGQPARLTLYSDPSGEEFFLPFRDATSGDETYGAGRYLDNNRPGLEQAGESAFEIDFNYAYNPYCAYSPSFSCPLPPRDNWLAVPIRAGEKQFEPK
ncbi:MAG: DUF1684 domain-containing protein [Anaerolineales bacterium]|nr:DUF1684 domain-containing protein [Anaerolineales bacterium]MCB8934296.1 DUF1684 domain-containing protein [Promineifilum sp.]